MFLVSSGTARHAPEKTRIFFISFCKVKKTRLNLTKFDLMAIKAPRQWRQI